MYDKPKPKVEDFRSIVAAFFAVRRESDPAKQAAAYDEFRRKSVSFARSLVDPPFPLAVNAPLPKEDEARERFLKSIEKNILASAEVWAYQEVVNDVYTGRSGSAPDGS
jgi:hypothetical protein